MNEIDAFNLPKAEICAKIDIFMARVRRNPKINGRLKSYMSLNASILKSRAVSESDLQYGIVLLGDMLDEIRSLAVRQGKTELRDLNPMFEAQLEAKLGTIPEEEIKPKVLLDFTKNMRFGGMRDD